MNEFAIDFSNELFKVYIEIKRSKNSIEKNKIEKRYIIISDSIIFIFTPYDLSKNLGNLIFYSYLYLIEEIQPTNSVEKFENKIKKKEKHLSQENFKRFKIKWKNSDIYIPNNNFRIFESNIISTIDTYYDFHDKLIHRKEKILQSFDLFSEDYHKYIPFNRMNLYDESKLVEICMYQEKSFIKNYYGENDDLKIVDSLLIYHAKEIIFLYKKILDYLNYKNDESVVIYRNKFKQFKELTGYSE